MTDDDHKHPPNPPLPADLFDELAGQREQWGFDWDEWYCILAALDVPEDVLLAARTADGLRAVHEAAREAHAAAGAADATAGQSAAADGGAAHAAPAAPDGAASTAADAPDEGWADGLADDVASAAEEIVNRLQRHSGDSISADFVREYVLANHDGVTEQDVTAALADHDDVTPPATEDGEWQWTV